MALPFIQFGLNQRILSFTNLSPNMIIFGANLTELQDIQICNSKLDKLKNKYSNQSSEFEYLQQLKIKLGMLKDILKVDMDKYVKIMKKQYDKEKKDDKFEINNKVMYYVGDRESNLRKLRHKWTGPWVIMERISANEVKILDNDSGNSISKWFAFGHFFTSLSSE